MESQPGHIEKDHLAFGTGTGNAIRLTVPLFQ